MSGATESHPQEAHDGEIAGRLNRLRAGVLGANDGIVSVAAIVVGVAGATVTRSALLASGLFALVGGAISMALGEYVSVSSQRDSERSMIDKERSELRDMPAQEVEELTELYQAKGLSAETAATVAAELTAHDALAAHLEVELHIDQSDLASPWQAASSSFLSFTIGAVLPLLAILLPPAAWRVPVTFAAVLAALMFTGYVSARAGGSPVGKSMIRLVLGGALALAATYLIGLALGTSGVV